MTLCTDCDQYECVCGVAPIWQAGLRELAEDGL